jgi:hypothetical protein
MITIVLSARSFHLLLRSRWGVHRDANEKGDLNANSDQVLSKAAGVRFRVRHLCAAALFQISAVRQLQPSQNSSL